MKNNFTTFVQSKRLIELGVPVDSADCVGYIVDKSIDMCSEYFQKGETRITVINPRHTYTQVTTLKYGEKWLDEPFPCWSVGRLIEIYNTCIDSDKDEIKIPKEHFILTRVLIEFFAALEYGWLDFTKLDDKLWLG